MYQNIIFDLGGVVVDYAPKEFLVDRFMNEKLEHALYEISFGSEEWRNLDAGLITREDANKIIRAKGAEMGRTFEITTILDDWMDILKTKDDTVQLMKKLKKSGYKLFYLSNVPWDVLHFLSQRKFWELFDGGVASCEVQLNKPDLQIYQKLLYKYHLNPKECIFIDDNKENATAAFDVDMLGIQFRNVRTLQRALAGHGIVVDRKKRKPNPAIPSHQDS